MTVSIRMQGALSRARTLYFLTHPREWPQWPFLPVIRRRPGEDPDLGVVLDLLEARGPPGYSCTVFRCNLFLLPRELDELLKLPREVFDTSEELADAGWLVDGD